MKNFQSLSFVSQSHQPEPDIWYFIKKIYFEVKIFYGKKKLFDWKTPPELKLRGETQIYNWDGHVRTYVKQFNKVGGIFQ